MRYRLLIVLLYLVLVVSSISFAEGFAGNIVSVDPEKKQVILDRGDSNGVQPGMVFYILNEDNYKAGTATIIEAGSEESIAIYNMLDEEQVRPDPGMLVVYSEDEEAVSMINQDVAITIPVNTEVVLEVVDRIGSQISQTGDVFKLKAAEPVIIDGYEVIAVGAEAMGEVTYAKAAKGWGKSGDLNLEVKYVKAVDDTNVLLSFEMEQNNKDSIAKAALGGYVTGFIGGGAIKGKKIWIDPGRRFNVFVKRNTTLAFVASGGSINKGAIVKTDIGSKISSDRKIMFLGLQDSFDENGSEANMVLASKLSSFISYYLQWNTNYKYLKRHKVIEQVGYDLDAYYIKRGENVPLEERYNIPAIDSVGREFGVDYVICGDILKYSLDSKKKRNWLLTAAAVTGGSVEALDGQVKQQYTIDVAIDLMIYDVNKQEVIWNSVYKDYHKVSMPLNALNSMGIGKPEPDYKSEIGNYHLNVYETEGYALSRSDDPISFSVTDEGFTVIRMISPFVVELENIL